jgi:hypothetical protein
MRTHGSKLGQRGGAAKIIKCVSYLVVTTLENSEDIQVTLMMTLGGVNLDAVDFSKNALAKSLQCHWNYLSQQLPIGFFDLARHRDSWGLTPRVSRVPSAQREARRLEALVRAHTHRGQARCIETHS